jgi:hypothetical protein
VCFVVEVNRRGDKKFVEIFPASHITTSQHSAAVDRQLINKFRETGSVADALRSGRP